MINSGQLTPAGHPRHRAVPRRPGGGACELATVEGERAPVGLPRRGRPSLTANGGYHAATRATHWCSAQRAHVQADLGVDHDLLGGRQPSASSWASGGTLRLTSASAIGPSSWCRAEVPTKPTDLLARAAASAPRAGSRFSRAVEVQQRQPARRPAEGVHPGDGLLAAVAALVEVHGGADPAGLVGDRAVVGVQAQPRLAAGDPQRLEGPQAAGRAGGLGVRRRAGRAGRARSRRTGRRRRRPGAGRQVTASSAVTSATSTRIMNRIRSSNSTSAAAWPGSVWAVNASPSSYAVERVLDVALRAEDQRAGPRLAAARPSRCWRGQRVQPGQPVGAADPDHVAVGEVDEARRRDSRVRCSPLNEP